MGLGLFGDADAEIRLWSIRVDVHLPNKTSEI
jgi:hypothetical protein